MKIAEITSVSGRITTPAIGPLISFSGTASGKPSPEFTRWIEA
jgi:hypothetical protein